MNKLTNEELRFRQSWTLNQKIDHSLGAIEQFYNHTNGKCVVSFSGGKDSTVLLHLVRRLYPDVKAVFVNTTNEFSEILKFVKNTPNVVILKPEMTFKDAVRMYGFPLVSKKVAYAVSTLRNPTKKNSQTRNLFLTGVNKKGEISKDYRLALKWRYLIDENYDITSKCCDILKHKPLELYQKQNNIYYFVGTMAENSIRRRDNYLRFGCNMLGGNTIKSRPLSIWTDEDIWNYIRLYKVPYCDVYDKGEHNTGCAYCGFGIHLEDECRFYRLQQREPKRFDDMMNLENNGVKYIDAITEVIKRSL